MSSLAFGIVLLLAVASSAFPTEVDQRRDNIDERGRGEDIYQGDIKLVPGVEARAGIVGPRYRWPSATLIFQLGPGFTLSELNLISSAMAEISQKTCIKFQSRSTEANYVYIVRGAAGTGCSSYVGLRGGRQELNLQAGSPGCIHHGIIVHELIHAIGYYHEQMRTDRDDFVTINWPNIQPGAERNFEKYSSSAVDPHGVAYDYDSIMHYSAYSFAVDPQVRTIFPKNTNVEIGQRVAMSSGDVRKLRNMYSCS